MGDVNEKFRKRRRGISEDTHLDVRLIVTDNLNKSREVAGDNLISQSSDSKYMNITNLNKDDYYPRTEFSEIIMTRCSYTSVFLNQFPLIYSYIHFLLQ